MHRQLLKLAAAGLIAGFVTFCGDAPAHAQNHTCPTAAAGDSTNKCASTAFVQAAVAGGGNLPLPNADIYVGNASNIATPVSPSGSGDCTFTFTNLGVFGFTCLKTNGVAFATSATTDTTNAGNIGSGTLAIGRLPQDSTTWRTATGADAILTTDCLKTVGLGGNSLFSETLPAVTGFPAGCEVTVKNTDVYSGTATGRGKQLIGFPADVTPYSANPILYPDEIVRVKIVNGAWVATLKTARWIIPTSAEICYRQDGSATADGLGNGLTASDCLPLVQSAVTTIGERWDGGGYNACSVGIYAGGTNIITETVSQTGQSIGCFITVNMRGAVTWTSTAQLWTAGDGSIAVFNFNLGFTPTLKCNTANVVLIGCFYGHQVVIYDINGSAIWIPGGTHDDFVVMDAQGRATLSMTTLTVGDGTARSANSLLNCAAHCSGLQLSGTVAFTASVTLGQAYVLHTQSYINVAGASYTGSPTVTNASTPSGNSVLIGGSIPGGTATATGGQVCASAC